MSKAVGYTKLPIAMYCSVDCLQRYEAIISGIPISIHFPQYVRPEKRSLEMGSLIAPDIAKGIRENNKELDWGRIDHRSLETTGGLVQIIAIECKEDDVQPLYETFNPWLERFQTYCFLCNKQFFNVVESTSSGGNRLVLLGKEGYIHPVKPQTASMTLQLTGKEAYLKSEHIQKAIEYASSGKHIRPEYEFMQQAYEAEEKHLHKLSIINAASALESCLLKQIDQYCNQHTIDMEILTRKYKYLGELVDLESKFDNGFAQMKVELNENVCKARNGAVHFKENVVLNRETAFKCIESVEKALGYFYDDFAE